ncbi:hypothetical protein ACFL0D_09075 [Thermoproteota archaeon]
MKTSKIFGVVILIIQLMSAVALIVAMHTMLGVFVTALPSGGEEVEIKFTDPVIIPFTLTPVNNGYLEATMDVSIRMIVNGVEIASDSAVVSVPSHSIVPVELELSIPLSEAQGYLQRGVDLQWETDISVTTLYDLISFSTRMIIEGEGQ